MSTCRSHVEQLRKLAVVDGQVESVEDGGEVLAGTRCRVELADLAGHDLGGGVLGCN